MKKIFFILLLLPLFSYSQPPNLDGITVNINLRSGDWAFLLGQIPATDSAGFQRVRRVRDTILLANPANYNTNVRFNNVSATLVYKFYTTVKTLPQTLYERVGTNIDTQIKAIPNATLQSAITAFDAGGLVQYQITRNLGKNIVMDN